MKTILLAGAFAFALFVALLAAVLLLEHREVSWFLVAVAVVAAPLGVIAAVSAGVAQRLKGLSPLTLFLSVALGSAFVTYIAYLSTIRVVDGFVNKTPMLMQIPYSLMLGGAIAVCVFAARRAAAQQGAPGDGPRPAGSARA